MSLSQNKGWIPDGDDNDPFLQLDMGQPYQLIGLIKGYFIEYI